MNYQISKNNYLLGFISYYYYITTITFNHKIEVIMNIKEENLYRRHSSSCRTNGKEWPVMTKEFKRLQRQQYELFPKKQHDYGPGNISVCNIVPTEILPVP